MIEGTIVNLRAPDMADLERNHRWINDREVTRFLGGQARYLMSMAAEEAWMRGVCERQQTYERVFFAIETKDGRHIGNTNFFNSSAEQRRAELGIMIGERACWSRGFGTDALRALVGFGFDEMNLHRIDLSVDEDNARAIACYRKCGFVEEGRLRHHRYAHGGYRDQLWMGLLRDEFHALHGTTATGDRGDAS